MNEAWVLVVGVVMESVHKLGYGHKFEGSAATSVISLQICVYHTLFPGKPIDLKPVPQ
jgi:hypothetical protein